MNKQIQNPIGVLGRFIPSYLLIGYKDEREGEYCKIIHAEFWENPDEDYGELEIEFIDSGERLTIGTDEFEML